MSLADSCSGTNSAYGQPNELKFKRRRKKRKFRNRNRTWISALKISKIKCIDAMTTYYVQNQRPSDMVHNSKNCLRRFDLASLWMSSGDIREQRRRRRSTAERDYIRTVHVYRNNSISVDSNGVFFCKIETESHEKNISSHTEWSREIRERFIETRWVTPERKNENDSTRFGNFSIFGDFCAIALIDERSESTQKKLQLFGPTIDFDNRKSYIFTAMASLNEFLLLL